MYSPIPKKRKKGKKIISNEVLHGGWGIVVIWTRSRFKSGGRQKRDMEDKSKGGGPIPPIEHIFLI